MLNGKRKALNHGSKTPATTRPTPYSLHLFPPPGTNCDKFGGGRTRPLISLHLFPPPGNNCDKFRGGHTRALRGWAHPSAELVALVPASRHQLRQVRVGVRR